MADPLYKKGQRVRVKHVYEGEWTGYIVKVANAGCGEDAPDWEYEVSNAPSQMGGRWFPLLWESEITEVIQVGINTNHEQ